MTDALHMHVDKSSTMVIEYASLQINGANYIHTSLIEQKALQDTTATGLLRYLYDTKNFFRM